MPDYKLLYLTLLDGVEKAIENLKNVEIACEEIYIDTDETQEQKIIKWCFTTDVDNVLKLYYDEST